MNNPKLDNLRTLKLVTAIFETILAIPIYGGMIVLSLIWLPLIVMLILHIVTVVESSKLKIGKKGSIMGIITSLIGWIPLVGMICHMITAVMLWIDYSKIDDIKSKEL